MVSVCFYFQVHQPYRLRRYSVFEIGKNNNYFDEKKNTDIIEKVSRKCYLPANKLMLDLLNSHPEFRVSYSFSGIFLEQLEKYSPETLQTFIDLVDTGQVEILDETYYHSLAFFYSKDEFREQVSLHNKKIRSIFNYKPTTFRNTELIYNNEIAHEIEKLGYHAVLAEGADHVLGWRSPNFVYTPKTANSIKLLLKNYKLSDDIAFRFSNHDWKEYPLTVPKYVKWLNDFNGSGEIINLFMDYETFGEHQWSTTGIFRFLRDLPAAILKHPDNDFKTPSEISRHYRSRGELDIHNAVSWADVERDLSAWTGNKMQQSAISNLYDVGTKIKQTDDAQLLEDWRKLQTSDHFYYMCTKWFNDGDVHKYFNPYDSPYECFIAFMNILQDMKIRLKKSMPLLEKEVV